MKENVIQSNMHRHDRTAATTMEVIVFFVKEQVCAIVDEKATDEKATDEKATRKIFSGTIVFKNILFSIHGIFQY